MNSSLCDYAKTAIVIWAGDVKLDEDDADPDGKMYGLDASVNALGHTLVNVVYYKPSALPKLKRAAEWAIKALGRAGHLTEDDTLQIDFSLAAAV